MNLRSTWLVSLVVFLMAAPAVAADTFVRNYEASSTFAYGSGYVGGAHCMGGQDTLFDTGGCVAYHVPGVYDHRGGSLVVSVTDTVFGADTWIVVVVDLDGDGRSDCAIDDCYEGQGVVAGIVPLDTGGRFVRAFPVTLHTSGLGGVPDGFATRGTLSFTFA